MIEIIGGLVGLVFLIVVVGVHLTQQKQANSYLEAIERHLRAIRQVQAPQAKSGDRWTCQKCAKTNPMEMLSCGYCGTARAQP